MRYINAGQGITGLYCIVAANCEVYLTCFVKVKPHKVMLMIHSYGPGLARDADCCEETGKLQAKIINENIIEAKSFLHR